MPAVTEEETARFFYEFFLAHPEIIAPFKDEVNSTFGAPRHLTVETLAAVAIASGIHGELLVRNISAKALAFHPSTQFALGVTRTRHGVKVKITERKAGYLFDQLATAFTDPPQRSTITIGDHRVDVDTGEVLPDTDPAPVTVELLGNRILAALWRHVGIPDSPEWALDSEVKETHYAALAYGGKKDIDPAWVADQDQDEVDGSGDVNQRLAAKHRTWSKEKGVRRTRKNKARAPKPSGPTAEGSFIRRDKRFPQVGEDGRLFHTKDKGAASTYRGAGANRKSSFAVGRDKHTLVASGHFPDGEPYPPILRTYTCVLGGSSRTFAGLRTFDYANDTGVPDTHRKATMDRIYTGVDTDGFQLPLTDLGWEVTKSLTHNQKAYGPWNEPGVLLVDGFFYTDAIPTRLRTLPKREIGMTKKELARLEKRYDQRGPYAFYRNGRTNAGSLRFRGPAVPSNIVKNDHGQVVAVHGVRVNCPNSPYHHVITAKVKMTKCRRGHPCGCNTTFTVAERALPSSFEPKMWGSSRWAVAYNRRNLVESFNAVDSYHYRVGRHSIRVQADKWDLAHLFLMLAGWFKQVRAFLMREGAHGIDFDDYPGGPFHPEVVAAVLERVTAVPVDGHPPPGG